MTVPRPSVLYDALALVRDHANPNDYAGQVDFFLDLLLQPGKGEADNPARRKLVEFFPGRGSERGRSV